MDDLSESLGYHAADADGRTDPTSQIRSFSLQDLKLFHEPVVLEIRHARLVENIVLVIVTIEKLRQLLDPLSFLVDRFHHSPSLIFRNALNPTTNFF